MKKLALAIALIGFASTAALANDMSNKFAKMDVNKDGMISAAEHDAWAKAKFTKADSNKDGSISKEEMSAMHDMHKKEMKN